jgi:hypothetical protein
MSHHEAMSAPVTSPARKRPRGFETVRDMVLSMAVVGAVVAATFWMVAWQRPEVQGPIRPAVDVEQVFTDVRVAEPFPVLEPIGLDWTATSAWFETDGSAAGVDGGVLHVGYLTPAGSYAEVRQTDGESLEAIDEWVDGAVPVDKLTVGGLEWQVVEADASGKQGLVTTVDGTTVVVTGKAELVELQELAGSLR